MNLFQLEYFYISSVARLNKRRSFFYRPECIVNEELWSTLRKGTEVLAKGDETAEMSPEAKTEAEKA